MICPGIYEEFSEVVHRAIPEDVLEMWHEYHDEEDDD